MPEDAVPRHTDEAGSLDALNAESERMIAEQFTCMCGEGPETHAAKHTVYCEFRQEWDRQIDANRQAMGLEVASVHRKATKKKRENP